jgi:NAD(P)-dependent dehydrogenase (short-subunit alcohol dehydrogenase family)
VPWGGLVNDRRDVAIITGGGSGVGRATARLLASNGIAVVAIDRRWPEDDLPDGVDAITGDIVEDVTWAQALEAAAPLGGPSMLVLNAAKLAVGTVLELPEDDFRSVIEVNVLAAVKGLRATLPEMIARGKGSIVGVASTASLYAEQALAAYSTSKGALLQLIRSVAVDHARQGIRANAVCPGAVDTPFFRMHVDSAQDPEAFLRAATERHPSGRILDPEDVARVIAFLLSDASLGMTGASVLVDGGLTATYDFEPPAPS